MTGVQFVTLVLSAVFVLFGAMRAIATWRLSTAAKRAAKALEVICEQNRMIVSGVKPVSEPVKNPSSEIDYGQRYIG